MTNTERGEVQEYIAAVSFIAASLGLLAMTVIWIASLVYLMTDWMIVPAALLAIVYPCCLVVVGAVVRQRWFSEKA